MGRGPSMGTRACSVTRHSTLLVGGSRPRIWAGTSPLRLFGWTLQVGQWDYRV